ncbi:Beta-hexosaminidase [Halomonadaceae bacterium LMG 33818]|uniref:beta-N-acetylhexosaminidase n=1 Tax=Cernens ardua TaxID=3402176 RepID=UPI003EDBB3D2
MRAAPGPIMIDVGSTSLDEGDRQILRHPSVGAIILFARNMTSPEQTRALCDDIRAVRPDILIAVDHEGGRVQRLREGLTHIPPMCSFESLYIETPDKTLSLVRDTGWLMSQELAACGFDFTFAPVLDVDDNRSKVIGERSFSSNPEHVVTLAGALITGLNEGGMPGIGKHYPGHGGVVADSHLEMPVDPRPFTTLERHDLIPFARLATRLSGVMPAHVRYPDFSEEPAGFSSKWLTYLREALNFDGAILSDDMSMQGAHFAGGPVSRAEKALAAGCDMVLMCNDRPAAEAVLEATATAGIQPHGSMQRLNALRYTRERPALSALANNARWLEAHHTLNKTASEYGY